MRGAKSLPGVFLTASLLLAGSAWAQGLETAAESKLDITIQDALVLTIDAQDVSPELLLDSLSERLGFTLAWTGLPVAEPLVSGSFSGTLEALLPRLLRNRGYIAVMGGQGITRLVVTSDVRQKAVVERLSPDKTQVVADGKGGQAYRLALGFGEGVVVKGVTQIKAAAAPPAEVVHYEIPPGKVAALLEGLSLQTAKYQAAQGPGAALGAAARLAAKGGEVAGLPPRRSQPPRYGKAGDGRAGQRPKAVSAASDGGVALAPGYGVSASTLASVTAAARLNLKALVSGLDSACQGTSC